MPRGRSSPELICTLGPASASPAVLRDLTAAGMTLLRVNCSHYQPGPTRRLVEQFRRDEGSARVMVDLQGPRIRVAGGVPEIPVRPGQLVCFVALSAPGDRFPAGPRVVPLAVPHPFASLAGVRCVYIKDGTMRFDVEEDHTADGYFVARTTVGGIIRGQKGVNIPGALDHLPALTDRDRHDLVFGREIAAEVVLASFVNRAADIDEVRRAVAAVADSWAPEVWAKIETRTGVANLDEIARAADGLVIGRGDLAVEVGFLEAPAVQTRVLEAARRLGSACCVATQILESMRVSPVPTRGELRDIYVSLREGATGFMLTAETSVGRYPVDAVTVVREMIGRYGGLMS